jgi:hypothetical protein
LDEEVSQKPEAVSQKPEATAQDTKMARVGNDDCTIVEKGEV